MLKILDISHQELNVATKEIKVHINFEGLQEPQIMEFKKEDPESVDLYNKLIHVVKTYPNKCHYDPTKRIFKVESDDNLLFPSMNETGEEII